MKAFNGILENGITVEITHNEANTHFYIDNKRIKATLAIEAKEKYEANLVAEKEVKPAKKEKAKVIAPTGLSAEEVISKLQTEKSTYMKKALIAGNITPELIALLNLNKKSSKGKGINLNRYNKFVEKCESSENEDIIRAYKQVNRSDEFRPTHMVFITNLNGKSGEVVRFEINTAEKFSVMSAIPIGKEELYLGAISKSLKIGVSDKVIDELLE